MVVFLSAREYPDSRHATGQALNNTCKHGKFLNGDDIDGKPKLFIGAAANPFGDPCEFRVRRLARKIAAGVDFVQTQSIYNMEKFREFVKKVAEEGIGIALEQIEEFKQMKGVAGVHLTAIEWEHRVP